MLHTIVLTNSAETLQLPDKSKLTDLSELAEGVIPFSCLSGICGSCVIEVECGLENLSEAEPVERTFLTSLGFAEDQYRLACQCKLFGPISINTEP
ncbi:2Fe-2S iron-sulfur cluster-binding protein [Jeongeupia naejangsanensis]|uniref:(2Fe-2S)-binding protein n=1 Tax=Jeongeupia naejangsanensis TaxID=613195 RepID=A0ABS2BHV8_9NEIS|nr:2Fe-2S iron-sulfur cluster-binding protein [Jeongeupia naejangsanensis]MBM3115196.1 (2Fe-2S)-binding protein [Jeongeupia naejangsanensis]